MLVDYVDLSVQPTSKPLFLVFCLLDNLKFFEYPYLLKDHSQCIWNYVNVKISYQLPHCKFKY